MHEIRLALRRLRQRPAVAVLAALTLALGVGAVTAAFAAVDAVLLRDLPVLDQDELVVVRMVDPRRDFIRIPFTPRTYEAIAPHLRSLAAVAGVARVAEDALVEGDGESWVMSRIAVAGDVFGVVGARPALGRLLTAEDDEPGAAPVLVLGHDVWTSRFAADPAVVGSVLRYADRSFTVVGVAARGFAVPGRTDAWVTVRGAHPVGEEPCCIELDAVGRVRPGADAEAVAADLVDAIRTEPDLAAFLGPLQPRVASLEEEVTGSLRPVLAMGLAAALLLLLAAAANATLLLMAGGSAAARDVAIRMALGAERAAIAGRLLADAAVVGLLGTAGGVALAWLALHALLPLAPAELARFAEVTLDARSLTFALAVGLAATGLAGGAAGLVAARAGPAILQDPGTGGGGRGSSRFRRGVAGLQIALTVVIAVAAGLLVRTVVALDRLEPGLDVEGLSVVTLSTPYSFGREVPEAWFGALERVAHDLEGRAGILAARPTLQPPLEIGLAVALRSQEQAPEEAAGNPYVWLDAVMPGHFEALAIPLLAGRTFVARDDDRDADPVAVVGEATARALWPGEDPLGKRISGFADPGRWWTVVGVVADTRYSDALDPRPAAYYPMRRLGTAPPSRLLVRTAPGAPASVRAAVSEAFAEVEPRVRVLREERVVDVLRRPTVRPRFAAGVLLSFAAVTAVLAALGVYGVFTILISERAREMGVRRALGAQRSAIVRLVMGGILRVAAAGAAVGLVASLWAARIVESLLYGIALTDPGTLALVVGASVALALAAGLAPALRASRTDPAVSLRAE